ncbi:putative oxygen-independent coproporphyrinogen III oxidase [Clostridium sp. CAG:632]|jgi:oxygen-independent coproporphyrinogen-3 oxidase|nr:oxygen-independent coproporphyrinogen III oxidase [Clostridium sp.]CCY58626.1 putative oxygen-independent coproporphyrinogen III oxidase [Clostridium sp. CAG:632]
MRQPISLYLHIPFCVKKCHYCDFLSFPGCSLSRQAEYVDAMIQEIHAYREAAEDYEVKTIFLGGGTPSLLEKELVERLFHELYSVWRAAPETEITIEANPGTLSREKLIGYHMIGINRLSLGLQSTIAQELATIGRIHNYEQFLANYYLAREAGFDNINIDIMSALPGQTLISYGKTLERILKLQPEHISSYSLILEEGTDFWENAEIERALPSEQTERIMYHYTKKCLQNAGYERYEISNYAKPGYACLHNQVYWTGGEYLGLGLGAASYWKGARFSNTPDMEEYMENCSRARITENRKEIVTATQKSRMEEYMFLGLRMIRGVSIREFERRFGIPMNRIYGTVIRSYIGQGLLKIEQDRLMLTERGIDVSNSVMADFLLEE